MNTDAVIRDANGDPILTPQAGQKGYANGKEYTYYFGDGWFTDDELFELRQTDPRMAP